jgi:hypothetical protein
MEGNLLAVARMTFGTEAYDECAGILIFDQPSQRVVKVLQFSMSGV